MSKNLELKKLGKNIGMTFARSASGMLLGLATGVLLARMLGPQGKGFLVMAMLLPVLIIKFLNLGMSSASVYFISRKDYSVETVVFNNIIVGLVLSIISLIIGLTIIHFGRNSLLPGIPYKFLLLGLMSIPIALLLSFMTCIFQGLQDFKIYNVIIISAKIINLILIVIFVWILKGYVQTAILVNIFSQLIIFVVTFLFLKRYLDSKEKKVNLSYIKASLSYGWKAHLSNIFSFLNYRADMFLLNWFINPVAVGIYSISVGIAERLWIFSGSAATVMFPRIAELKNDEASRRELTPLVSRSMLWIPLLLSLPIYLLAPYIIELLFGIKFIKAALLLRILLPGIVIGSMSRILSNDIAGRGYPIVNMYIALVIALSNIILNIILIPRFGIIGAAVATTICYGVDALIIIVVYSLISKVKWYRTFILEKEDFKLLIKLFNSIRRANT